MAQIIHDVDLPNTGNGDPLRTAFINQNEMNTELYETKVDKVIGKDLSENDFTDLEKSKLAGIEEGAQVNVPINYGDIIGAPVFNNIAAYPETKYNYIDTTTFTIPENVQAITVRKNGDSTDNLEDWTQLGDEITYLGTLTTGDYLIIGGVFVIPSGGDGGTGDLITKFTSNPVPTIVGTDITIPANETWLIDSVPHTNPTASVIPFTYASTGLLYFLSIVATTANTFVGKIGTESTEPSLPTIANDELFLTSYLISDGSIDVVIPPVNSNIYVEKESFAPLNLISSGHVASIELDKRNNIIFSGNITKTGNVIKNNSNHFVIGLPFTTTNKTDNQIEVEHMNTSGGSGSIAYFNTEELSYFLQPNEVAIWISEILNGQKIHRRVSSYIDRDSVIYRSGTEVGKPVYGVIEIENGASLVTEEVGGVKSHLHASEGIWIIEITDGIDNLYINFDPNKGIFSDKLFDLDNDENVYIQKGHVVQLEEDVFNLQLANTGDETTASIQAKRPLKTVNGSSLEGSGNIVIAGGGGAVDSVNGQTGVVVLTASDVGAPSGSGNSTGTNTGDNSTNTNSNAYADSKVADSIVDGVANVAPSQNAVFDALALKQDNLTDANFGTFTTSVADKNTQSDTDVLAYVDITTGKWVKQTFTNLIAFFKGFFVDKTTDQSIDGIKTFTASPIVPTATTGTQAINLNQLNDSKNLHSVLIDNNIGDIVQHTGTTMSTIVKTYTIPAGFFTSDCVFETDLTISKIGTAGNIMIGFGIAPSGTTLPIHLVVTTAGNRYINIGRKMTMIKNGLIIGFGNSGNFYSDKIVNGSALNKASTFDPTISNTFNLLIQLGDASDIALLENLTIKVYKNA